MPKPKHPTHRAAKHDETDSDEEIEDQEHDEEEEEEEFDLVKRMNEMDLPIRRKTYALKGLQKKHRELRAKCLQEIAEAELKLMADTDELRVEREKVILGEREVTEEEIKKYQDVKKESGVEEIDSDEETTAENKKKSVKIVSKDDETAKNDLQEAADKPDGGIPRFWLTALRNNEVIEGMIAARDPEALAFLINITKEYLDNNPRKGFKLKFHFTQNNYFTNKVLEKTYIFDTDEKALDSDDPMLETIEGCEIDWTNSAMNLTISIKKKKQRHKDGKSIRVVNREEKCASFFNFFTAPKQPDDDDEDDDEDDEEIDYEEEMEMDYEAATVISDLVIPRAVHYYCGKSIEEIAAGLLDGLDDEEDEEDEEEEDEEEETATLKKKPVPKRGKSGGGRGGAEQPECKQQ